MSKWKNLLIHSFAHLLIFLGLGIIQYYSERASFADF
jgi:hypothetical protein